MRLHPPLKQNRSTHIFDSKQFDIQCENTEIHNTLLRILNILKSVRNQMLSFTNCCQLILIAYIGTCHKYSIRRMEFESCTKFMNEMCKFIREYFTFCWLWSVTMTKCLAYNRSIVIFSLQTSMIALSIQ